jgi:hypothetical protein
MKETELLSISLAEVPVIKYNCRAKDPDRVIPSIKNGNFKPLFLGKDYLNTLYYVEAAAVTPRIFLGQKYNDNVYDMKRAMPKSWDVWNFNDSECHHIYITFSRGENSFLKNYQKAELIVSDYPHTDELKRTCGVEFDGKPLIPLERIPLREAQIRTQIRSYGFFDRLL